MEFTEEENLQILKELYPNISKFVIDRNYKCCLGTHVDHKPSLGINRKTGKWHCFTCNESGNNLDSLYYKVKGRHFKKLNNEFYFVRDREQYNQKLVEKEEKYYLPKINHFVETNLKNKHSQDVLNFFLQRRALTLDILNQINAKVYSFIEFESKDEEGNIIKKGYLNKIAFPQYDINYNLLNYELRNLYINSSDPKTLRPKGYKSKFLCTYTKDLDFNKPIYIHEGLMDMLVFKFNCNDNTACTNGALLNDEILKDIVKFKNIVVIPDNDDTGKKLPNQILEYINNNLLDNNLYILYVPKKDDIKDTTDLAKFLKTKQKSLKDFWPVWKTKIEKLDKMIL